MKNNPLRGLGFVFQGLSLITKPGLRRFVAIPLLINTLLFSAAIWFGYQWFSVWLDHLLPDWLEWASWLLVPLFTAALLVLTFFTFTLLVNLISAPFNGLLAERTELYLSGKPLPEDADQSWKKVVKDIWPSIRSELGKLGYFIAWSIPLLLLFIIPVLNVAAPFLWLAFSVWFMAIEYGDFPMGNHQLHFPEQKKWLKKRRLSALGFGSGMMVLTSLPFLNFLAVPVGVVGATALWVAGSKEKEVSS